jgi:hypothetical protein
LAASLCCLCCARGLALAICFPRLWAAADQLVS